MLVLYKSNVTGQVEKSSYSPKDSSVNKAA